MPHSDDTHTERMNASRSPHARCRAKMRMQSDRHGHARNHRCLHVPRIDALPLRRHSHSAMTPAEYPAFLRIHSPRRDLTQIPRRRHIRRRRSSRWTRRLPHRVPQGASSDRGQMRTPCLQPPNVQVTILSPHGTTHWYLSGCKNRLHRCFIEHRHAQTLCLGEF